MSLRFHEIAESSHRILNPFSEAKLALLGELCRLRPGARILDLACGKGELLASWSARWGTRGTGVDLSEVFLAAARERAAELRVADRIEFVQGDAAAYGAEPGGFDLVSCIGATWIGDGLVGTLELMKPALAPDGLLLVGEPFLHAEPPAEAYADFGATPETFTTLPGLLPRFEEAGCELLEMVLADPDSWDRYEAAQWRTLSDWLRANPDDPDTPALHRYLAERRHGHLAYRRPYLGWGVFVLRPTG
ncbi:SAM-dependent methyltransferase [Kitasatospora sp. NPDC048365]|uniref:SAM-dependent methyltransferase n=1 Tax=Kitasatospora sp. NPDC048365 TaxID=3364050 RepID=UPI0037210CEF